MMQEGWTNQDVADALAALSAIQARLDGDGVATLAHDEAVTQVADDLASHLVSTQETALVIHFLLSCVLIGFGMWCYRYWSRNREVHEQGRM